MGVIAVVAVAATIVVAVAFGCHGYCLESALAQYSVMISGKISNFPCVIWFASPYDLFVCVP